MKLSVQRVRIWNRVRNLTHSKYFGIICISILFLFMLFTNIQLFQSETGHALDSNSTFDLKERHPHIPTQQVLVTKLLTDTLGKLVQPQDILFHSKATLTRMIPVNHASRQIHYTSRIMDRDLAEKTPAFKVAITSKERRLFQDILLKLKTVLDRNGIEFFLYSGSLLGSYRHHDIIPWDDDVDIIISVKHRKQLQNVLKHLRPLFILHAETNRWKFYSIQSRPIKKCTWSWPFLDISFYYENSTHIWDLDHRFSKYYTYSKSDIFPLTRRPFMDMLLPAPRNTSAVLEFYKSEICKSRNYNHRFEQVVLRTFKTNCDNLNYRYPMVTRQRIGNGINETLVLGGKTLRWFFTTNM